ncbi:hypothetical protein FACS1894181_17610 [Bacteroidia bacterium]|nr:hypothetical protein FACS1894181_17610 [Bacteroidia bacterium]
MDVELYFLIHWGEGNGFWETIKLSDIESFMFDLNRVFVFWMKNGDMLRFEQYRSVGASLYPAGDQYRPLFDMQNTQKFGGAAYGNDFASGDKTLLYASVFHRTKGIMIYDFANKKLTKYPIASIHPNVWSKYADRTQRISVWIHSTEGFLPAMTSIADINGYPCVSFVYFIDGTESFASVLYWNFNSYTNIVSTTFKFTSDGGIEVSGGGVTHTFNPWD